MGEIIYAFVRETFIKGLPTTSQAFHFISSYVLCSCSCCFGEREENNKLPTNEVLGERTKKAEKKNYT